MSRVFEAFGQEGFGNYEVEWRPSGPEMRRVTKPAHGFFIPGFVDLHIHGAYGIDFMSASQSDMATLCSKLAGQGYEAFLATTVTATAHEVLDALQQLPSHPLIAGFHLEGPFISSSHPGAQPQNAIEKIPASASPWDEVFAHPMLRYITLAPEEPHALELAAKLMQRGVIVSMGHTNATFDQARAGFEFGASHVTHTFNAMRGFHHREPGIVGYALLNDSVTTELIYDRHHVVQDAARLLFKCKPKDRVIAVSDSSMATGLPHGKKIKMWGMDCVVGEKEVRLLNGTLSGSAITLLDAFQNLHEDFGFETAFHACCVNPRRALKMGEPRVYVEINEDYKIVERFEIEM